MFHIPKMSIFAAGIIFLKKQMNRIRIFLSSVQNEFASERRRIADYIRQDALPDFHQDDDFRIVIYIGY